MPSNMVTAKHAIVACCVLSFSSMFVASTAWGLATEFGSVQIVVTDQNDVPIPNVNLCLAMPGQGVQKTTDQNGRYNTALPVGTTTVHTSRNGFANTQETFSISNGATLVRQIRLQPGQFAPLPNGCGSITATASSGSGGCDRITDLQVAGGPKTANRTVNLVVGFSERPAFYRITEFSAAERFPEPQFNPDQAFAKKSVPWLPITTPVLTTTFTLTEPHYGTHPIYIQTSLAQGGCVSHARGVSITLEPAKLQTYQLDKKDLLRFLKTADGLGYRSHSEFRFLKKDKTYCLANAMVEPSDPLGPRKSNTIIEDVAASFEVFIGPPLMPFWELREIQGFFPGLSTERIPPRVDAAAVQHAPVMTWDSYASATCPYCSGAGTLRRTLSWRRILYEMYPSHHIAGVPDVPAPHCVLAPDPTRPGQQPYVTKLTLVGPAGEDPVNALGALKSNTIPAIQPLPPPRIIMPRGVEGQDQAQESEAGTQEDGAPTDSGKAP